MPRFFFHLREGEDLLRDSEGTDLADMTEVEREAKEGARSIANLKPIDHQQFEIEDEGGRTVLIYPLMDAFSE